MSEIFKILDGVTWFSDLKDENVFRSLGLNFAFTGKDAETFSGYYPKQVHGTEILEASEIKVLPTGERSKADGIYTQKASQRIGVQTADCVPLLLASESGRTVMALHAGWRGLTAGIVMSGVQKMKTLNPKESVFAVIGPSIAPCHYEVGPELVQAISNPSLGLSGEEIASCLTHGVRDRYFLDLQTAGIFFLVHSGLKPKQISIFRSCTFCHPEFWHSFRRDASSSGRNWSWIEALSD